jgi:hypothetical protein
VEAVVMRGVVAALVASLLCGCVIERQRSHSATKSETTRNLPAFCEVTKRMTWAARDTVQSQNQIRAHNALFDKFCRPEGSPNGKH